MSFNHQNMSVATPIHTLPGSYLAALNEANVHLPVSDFAYYRSPDAKLQSFPLGRPLFGQPQEINAANPKCAAGVELAKEFHALVKRWKEETFFLSSLSKIFTHPAYQRIMAMGTNGLPLVLGELRNNQGNWFYALKYMAGRDVAEGFHNFEDARAAWLEWGYRNNYL